MSYIKSNPFQNIPPVVKNLIIINALMLVGSYALNSIGSNIPNLLSLHFFKSTEFYPFQLITHMFMHGGLWHLLLNMYALFLFGSVLEKVWGPKRFIFFYFVTGLGAALILFGVNNLQFLSIKNQLSPEHVQYVMEKGLDILAQNQNFADPIMAKLNLILNSRTVGASGAIYGVLLAFGMLFPNTQLMLLFPPIPIKAKWLVIILGVMELYLGVTNQGGNIAHFAHLGGMIFGFILMKIWKKDQSRFY